MGTLGAGNHYAEIQVVEEIFDKPAARKMGIDRVGQVSPALSQAASAASPFEACLQTVACRASA